MVYGGYLSGRAYFVIWQVLVNVLVPTITPHVYKYVIVKKQNIG